MTIRSISARRSRSSCERGAIAWVQGMTPCNARMIAAKSRVERITLAQWWDAQLNPPSADVIPISSARPA